MRRRKEQLPQNSWILLLLYSPGVYDKVNEPIIGSLRLMKGLFLMSQEVGIKNLPPYKFEAYLYGPCSTKVYRHIDGLKMHGAINEQEIPRKRWPYYKLTYYGTKRAERLWKQISTEERRKIREIKTKVNKSSILELLRYIYAAYPKFAKNTVLSGLRRAQ